MCYTIKRRPLALLSLSMKPKSSVIIKCHICIRISLNIIYFTSITQKAQGTCKCVVLVLLKDADVGAMWSNVVEKTGEPGVTI